MFKAACLQYRPSDVVYEGQSFERKELIEEKEKLIRGVLGGLKHSHQFGNH